MLSEARLSEAQTSVWFSGSIFAWVSPAYALPAHRREGDGELDVAHGFLRVRAVVPQHVPLVQDRAVCAVAHRRQAQSHLSDESVCQQLRVVVDRDHHLVVLQVSAVRVALAEVEVLAPEAPRSRNCVSLDCGELLLVERRDLHLQAYQVFARGLESDRVFQEDLQDVVAQHEQVCH